MSDPPMTTHREAIEQALAALEDFSDYCRPIVIEDDNPRPGDTLLRGLIDLGRRAAQAAQSLRAVLGEGGEDARDAIARIIDPKAFARLASPSPAARMTDGERALRPLPF